MAETTTEMVTIRNKDGAEREWPKAAVGLISGWEVVDGSTDPYDPAEHNVDEVLEHLKSLTSEDEIARIVEAEAAGERASTQVAAWAAKQQYTIGDPPPPSGGALAGDLTVDQ